MRFIIFLMLISVYIVSSSRINTKSLTESQGQEVIEMSSPLKELPPEIEEEPSAEVDDDDKPVITSTTIQPATKKDTKRTTTDSRRRGKDSSEATDAVDKEEARIEKEIAEMYKDTTDYKDSLSSSVVVKSEKPIARDNLKPNFVFAPSNLKDKAEIERFRTSPDEISCNKDVTRKLSNDLTEKTKKSAATSVRSFIALGLATSIISCFL